MCKARFASRGQKLHETSSKFLDQYRQADDTLVRDQQTLKSLQDRLAKEGDSAPQMNSVTWWFLPIR